MKAASCQAGSAAGCLPAAAVVWIGVRAGCLDCILTAALPAASVAEAPAKRCGALAAALAAVATAAAVAAAEDAACQPQQAVSAAEACPAEAAAAAALEHLQEQDSIADLVLRAWSADTCNFMRLWIPRS